MIFYLCRFVQFGTRLGSFTLKALRKFMLPPPLNLLPAIRSWIPGELLWSLLPLGCGGSTPRNERWGIKLSSPLPRLALNLLWVDIITYLKLRQNMGPSFKDLHQLLSAPHHPPLLSVCLSIQSFIFQPITLISKLNVKRKALMPFFGFCNC